MTDEALIRQFLNGQRAAFNLLVWRWQKPILNFVYRYVGNRTDAEDICQRTFIKVYKNLHRLKDPGKFSTWLYQIAANLSRDWLRRKRRNNSISIEEVGGETSILPEGSWKGSRSDPEGEMHQQQLRHYLEWAMGRIPEEQRLVVVLKIYQGLKFTEIAEVLGLPVNTVKSRLYYGLRALREVLKSFSLDEEV